MKKTGIKLSTILLAVLAVLALIIGVTGCSSGGSDVVAEGERDNGQEVTESTDAGTTDTTAAQPAATTETTIGKRRYAVIETNKGKIVFELYAHKAPKTVENFVKLANSGFYNGIRWHRVEPGFVIQGGDPLSKDNNPQNDGLGGPGYKIKPEFNDVPHLKGTVAMARAKEPDSAGSQFYICLAPQPSLDGQYTVFGQVVEGIDVVEKIQVYDTMTKVYIEER